MNETKTNGSIKGWCPGALRPMMSGDGLLVRLRLSGGAVSLDMATKIAALARQFGNGKINLSARGNLQLRGVSQETYPALITALRTLNLLDLNEEAESVRNVLISPMAGLDTAALQDIRPVGKALEAEIARNEMLWQLPSKFAFIIEDGGAFPLTDIAADIRFVAVNKTEFGLELGHEPVFFGVWGAADVPAMAAKIVRLFVETRKTLPLRHMHDLISELGNAHICAFLGCEMAQKHPAKPVQKVALYGQKSDFYGLGIAFGFFSAKQLEKLVLAAEKRGVFELRLTPWRAILAVIPSDTSRRPFPEANGLLDEMKAAGFITGADDPRLEVTACVGAPYCSSASVAAPQDALQLAGLTPDLVHVSGCAKGCAHPKPARFTFTGRDGFYDLIENGKADAAPRVSGVSPDALTQALRTRIADAEMEQSLAL